MQTFVYIQSLTDHFASCGEIARADVFTERSGRERDRASEREKGEGRASDRERDRQRERERERQKERERKRKTNIWLLCGREVLSVDFSSLHPVSVTGPWSA